MVLLELFFLCFFTNKTVELSKTYPKNRKIIQGMDFIWPNRLQGDDD